MLPSSAAQGNPSNVVVITIDTLRADHLGCYGDRAIETPNLDALARSAARFTHAFTPVPITLPAHTALFTGSFPMATGVHDFSGNKVPASAVTLAKVLHDHGYSTAAFLGAAVLDSRFGLNQGFDTYFDHFDFARLDETSLDMVKRTGDQVVDNALEWLKANPRRPFFLWVHLYDAHYPYTPPEPYATRYPGRPYDGEIAFDDAQVGRLIALPEGPGSVRICGVGGGRGPRRRPGRARRKDPRIFRLQLHAARSAVHKSAGSGCDGKSIRKPRWWT